MDKEQLKKILYLDDETSNLKIFQVYFKKFFDVDVAETPAMAEQMMHEKNYHVLISDQRMPEMSGVEFFASAKKKFPDVERILITGYNDLEPIIDAINEAEIYRFVKKPWDPVEFRLTIEKAAESSALRRENKQLLKDLTMKNNELQLLLDISNLTANPKLTISDVLQDTCNSMLHAINRLGNASCRIQYLEKTFYSSLPFKDPIHVSMDMHTGNQKTGSVALHFDQIKGNVELRKYEHKLLEAITHQLELMIEWKRAAEKVVNAVMETEERERRRFAKDLHDGLGQNLAGISYRISDMLNNEASFTSENLDSLSKILDSAISETRQIAHNIMPVSLTEAGLDKSVRNIVENLNVTTHLKFNYFSNIGDKILPDVVIVGIYRIIQEALQNVLKHAKASQVLIQITCDEDDLLLTIEDNGKGFDSTTPDKGIGLSGILNRAKMLNGTASISSTPNEGTSINVEIPLTLK